MQPAFIVRFRPTGPWRIGPNSGARGQVDSIFHSDSLFSAVSGAMARLGKLQEWLDATALHAEIPAVRFSSCFPYLDQVLFVVPPRNLWPRPPSARIRWNSARFIPLPLVAGLIAETPPKEDSWVVDGASECLIPADIRFSAPGPFRPAFRSHASVDRITGATDVHGMACLEFAEGGGLWAVVAFSDEDAKSRWSEPVRAALRLLADSGMGGERNLGWGRSAPPEFVDGELPGLILPTQDREPGEGEQVPVETAHWLLSMFVPGDGDAIDWRRGNYSLVMRGGRVESTERWGEPKKLLRMVSEGSVLFASHPPRGAVRDVAPDGFPHPVFRSGFALTIPLALRADRASGVA